MKHILISTGSVVVVVVVVVRASSVRAERREPPSTSRSDSNELSSVCRNFSRTPSPFIRAQLTKAYQTANVLFEALKAVDMTQSIEVDREIQEAQNKVAEEMQIYVPYNILPFDPDSANQAIMKYPEIQAAVFALRNTRGIPWPKGHKNKKDEDILDWLQAMFGFQKDNVANQREHLILLLANVHISQLQLDERALTEAMEKLFENYKKWCKFLDRKSSLWLPTIQQEMAFELYGMLAGNVSPMTGENIKPAHGSEEEAFSRKVVTPIYEVIAKV
ncbi:hypothetical protein CRG98_018517 [Punica granatum]|uniref:Callose synthase 3-like n=1 Tax=Punica granatum TaxID=22663 RepID=A0A2I0JXU3_PUNGR|nr:hypothetical protein CRG98_018517 [Punica granatum]